MEMAGYFARQLAVQEIGPSGLEKMQSADVAIVGTGGVGTAAASCLSAMGIGKLKLIDQDVVEETNLHRLSLVDPDDLYEAKAEALARRINARYPWTKAKPIVDTLRQENCAELLEGANLVVDGTDNLRTRYALNRLCKKNHLPYLFTSAIANQGHLSIFNPPDTPCLECMMPQLETEPFGSCEALGVTSATVGTVGNLAANEATKVLLGLPSKILGHLLTIDLAGPEFILTSIGRRQTCGVCANAVLISGRSKKVAMLCGDGVANVLPEREMLVDLESLNHKIERKAVIASSESVFVYQRKANRVSVFKTGRLLINNVASEEAAVRIAKEVWKEISYPFG